MVLETDPTLSPSELVASPVAPASDESKAWIGSVRAGVKARLFATDSDEGLERPARIGRYVVIKRIGAGGMGVVFAAYDDKLDRKVAVKLLRPGHGPAGETARQRLLREAQAIARLSHRCVVQVYEVGTHRDEVFIAMEYVEGSTLKQWQPSRDWRDILGRYLEAGRGLCAAHDAGIVHRDFKADNVLVRSSDGTVRVADFGLARTEPQDVLGSTDPAPEGVDGDGDDEGGEASLTHTGLVMGTPAYMAPEQHLATGTDARTDQFSFCASLFEALYGYRAFAGDRLDELRANVLEGALEPAPRYTAVPAHVYAALARGLDVDPGRRHPTMEALLARLELPRPGRPWRRVAWALGLTSAIVMGGVAWSSARTTSRSTDALRIQTAFDAAQESDAAAELAQLRARSAAARWNDLVLAYARDADTPTVALATLQHLTTDDDSWHEEARALAERALFDGPAYAFRPSPAAIVGLAFAPSGALVARTDRGDLLEWSSPGDATADAVSSNVVDMVFAADGTLWTVLPGGRIATADAGVRRVHGGELTRIAASSDGQLGVGADDGTVLVIDADSTTTLRGHDGAIAAMSFHPDGDRLATADRGGRVVMWYLDRGTHRTMSAEGPVHALRWSADERVVALTSRGPQAWHGARATPVPPRIDGDTTLFDVLATADRTAQLQPGGLVVDLDDGDRLQLDRDRGVRCLAMSPDGRWTAAGRADGVVLWRTGPDASGLGPRGERRSVVPGSPVLRVHAFDDRVFVIRNSGEILVQDDTGFAQVASIDGELRAVEPSADGRWLAIDGTDGDVSVVDLTDPSTAWSVGRAERSGPGSLSWAVDGSALARLSCARATCAATVFHPDGRGPLTIGELPPTSAMHLSASGSRVAFQHAETLTEWDLETGSRRRFAPPAQMRLVAAGYASGGSLRMASTSSSPFGHSRLHVGQIDDAGNLRSLLERDGLASVRATARGDAVVLETARGGSLVWRLQTDSFARVPPPVLDGLDDPLVHLGPRGTRLWVGEADSDTVRFFDLRTKQLRVLPRPRGAVAWPEDGGWIELRGPNTLRTWGHAAPRAPGAFARWVRSRSQVDIPLSWLRADASEHVEEL